MEREARTCRARIVRIMRPPLERQARQAERWGRSTPHPLRRQALLRDDGDKFWMSHGSVEAFAFAATRLRSSGMKLVLPQGEHRANVRARLHKPDRPWHR